MQALDFIVMEPLTQVWRLLVAVHMTDGLDIVVAPGVSLFELYGNQAVRLVSDVAVMQGIEMGDVEQVLDQ
ncbi:hypothetical protein D3C72_2151930 [compost metagenome]